MNDKNKKVKEKCVIAKVCRFSITNPSLDKIMNKLVKHTSILRCFSLCQTVQKQQSGRQQTGVYPMKDRIPNKGESPQTFQFVAGCTDPRRR